ARTPLRLWLHTRSDPGHRERALIPPSTRCSQRSAGTHGYHVDLEVESRRKAIGQCGSRREGLAEVFAVDLVVSRSVGGIPDVARHPDDIFQGEAGGGQDTLDIGQRAPHLLLEGTRHDIAFGVDRGLTRHENEPICLHCWAEGEMGGDVGVHRTPAPCVRLCHADCRTVMALATRSRVTSTSVSVWAADTYQIPRPVTHTPCSTSV